MEPEGPLTRSQVPATCPYHEPDQSSPCPHIPFPEHPSLYYLPIYAWVFQVVSFLQVSSPKSCIRLSSPHTCYMPTHNVLLGLIIRTIFDEGVQIIKLLVMQFSPLYCYLVLIRTKYSHNTLFSNNLSLRSSLNVSGQVSHPSKFCTSDS